MKKLNVAEIERSLKKVNKQLEKIETNKKPTENQLIRRAELYAEQFHWELQLNLAKEREKNKRSKRQLKTKVGGFK